MELHALPDGRVVTIRAIRPDDGHRLQLAHAQLSPEARYGRFMTAKPQLSGADARYLADIDGCHHFALVATVAEPDGEAIVAVGRFVRLPSEPEQAEFAIVVRDDWQGLGLAGELLHRLAAAAADRGVQRFQAVMLADNAPIRRLIDRFSGGEAHWKRRGGSVIEADFDVRPSLEPALSVSAIDAGSAAAPAMIAPCAGS